MEMLNSQENPAAVRSNASHLVEGEDLADMVAIYLFHSKLWISICLLILKEIYDEELLTLNATWLRRHPLYSVYYILVISLFHFNSIIFILILKEVSFVMESLSARWATSSWWVWSPLCFSQSSIFSSTKEFTGIFYFLIKFTGILEISGYASIPVQYFKKGKLYHILTANTLMIFIYKCW